MKSVWRAGSCGIDGAKGMRGILRQSSASTAKAEMRSWSINGDFVTLQPTGVARYAREVTLALDALVAEGHTLVAGLDLTLLAPRQPQDLPLRSIPTRVIPEMDRPRLPQVW